MGPVEASGLVRLGDYLMRIGAQNVSAVTVGAAAAAAEAASPSTNDHGNGRNANSRHVHWPHRLQGKGWAASRKVEGGWGDEGGDDEHASRQQHLRAVVAHLRDACSSRPLVLGFMTREARERLAAA